MNPTRIAVIGVGAIGRKHADLLRAEPRCELVAVAAPWNWELTSGENAFYPQLWRRPTRSCASSATSAA